jgi:RNA polymerase subunit RPABC4/transcription elongation factor Spt4
MMSVRRASSAIVKSPGTAYSGTGTTVRVHVQDLGRPAEESKVTYVQCRDCGAAVPEDARWCTLCFADQREPAAVPTSDPVVVADVEVPDQAETLLVGAGDGLLVAGDAVSALVAATDPAEAAELPASVPAPAASTAPPRGASGEVRWPCNSCDEHVPMSLDACPMCGSPFLSGAKETPSMEIPMVGDLGRMSRTQRLVFGIVVAMGVMVVLIVGAAIIGHIF